MSDDYKEKSKKAIDLLHRAADTITWYADLVEHSMARADGKSVEQTRYEAAMRMVNQLEEWREDHAPDHNWFRDLFLLTGAHLVLTEEGWIPAEANTLDATGFEPMEILDEVNAPTTGSMTP